MRRTLALAASLVACAACDRVPARGLAGDAGPSEGVALAESGAPTRAAIEPLLRVVVGPEGIDVDDVDLFASWPPPLKARLLRELPEEAAALPFSHRRLVRVSGWRIAAPEAPGPEESAIAGLLPVLEYARNLERRYAEILGDGSPDEARELKAAGRANVHVAADAPYGLVALTLSSLVRSEFQPILIVRGQGGDGAIALDGTFAGARIIHGFPAVIDPWIALGPEGIAVTFENERALVVGPGGPLGLPPRYARAWEGRMILGSPGACPSVPRHGGADDLGALGALLRELVRADATSERIILAPSPDTRWQEIVHIAGVAAAAGLPRLALLLRPSRRPQPSCEGGLSLDSIRAVMTTYHPR